MLKDFWLWILKLFGIEKTITTDEQCSKNNDYTADYEDIENINFTAIFANKLSTLAVSESTLDIVGTNKRAELLKSVSDELWGKAKKIAARTLGTGGCVIVPYVDGGRLSFNIVSQNRLCINSKRGDIITEATVLAATVKIKGKRYYRFTNYKLENGNIYITTKATDDSGKPAEVETWQGIKDIAIANVDRPLFAYVKSPVDNRLESDDYGVPITYGCDEIVGEIRECLKQIKDEFDLKRVRLQVDERMFNRDKDGKPVLTSKLFQAVPNYKNENLFNIFDPALRDSSYYNRLNALFELFEKQVGTSKGILTTPESRGATATEIKSGMYDTYSLICDLRKMLDSAVEDFIYSCDVLANYYGLSPSGDYEIAFDWSYNLVESSSETWMQLKDAQSMGIRSKAEIRAWQTGETLEEAQKMIDEITVKEPTMQTILGGGNAE